MKSSLRNFVFLIYCVQPRLVKKLTKDMLIVHFRKRTLHFFIMKTFSRNFLPPPVTLLARSVLKCATFVWCFKRSILMFPRS